MTTEEFRKPGAVRFRDATSADDRRFCIAAWLDSSRLHHTSGLTPMSMWYSQKWPECEALLARTDMRTVVAFEKRDPTFLYGFIAADPTEQAIKRPDGSIRWWPALVLYVFVKQNYRGNGYARGLFGAVGIDPSKPFLYASNSPAAAKITARLPLAKFDSITVRFPKEKAA